MGECIGLEASIKDSKRFNDEPGNWAYFSFFKPKGSLSAKPVPAQSCNRCYEAIAAEDWGFIQYYPVLRAAKP